MNPEYRNVIRGWAIADLVLTGSLVFPPIATWLISLLLSISAVFGGKASLETFGGFGLMFVCITGALGVVWALARLLRPTRWLALNDAAARLWIGAVIVYFVFAHNVPLIFLLFVFTEWAGGIHQLLRLAVAPNRTPD